MYLCLFSASVQLNAASFDSFLPIILHCHLVCPFKYFTTIYFNATSYERLAPFMYSFLTLSIHLELPIYFINSSFNFLAEVCPFSASHLFQWYFLWAFSNSYVLVSHFVHSVRASPFTSLIPPLTSWQYSKILHRLPFQCFVFILMVLSVGLWHLLRTSFSLCLYLQSFPFPLLILPLTPQQYFWIFYCHFTTRMHSIVTLSVPFQGFPFIFFFNKMDVLCFRFSCATVVPSLLYGR